MSEKIGGAKGTELDNDFHEMERVSVLHEVEEGGGSVWVVALLTFFDRSDFRGGSVLQMFYEKVHRGVMPRLLAFKC